MQTITKAVLGFIPDFQQNGKPLEDYRYCQIVRGYLPSGVPILVKMVGGELNNYLAEEKRKIVLDNLYLDMVTYHNALMQCGVGVSEFYEVHRTDSTIFEVTIDGGMNLSGLLQRCSFYEGEKLIKWMIESIVPVLENPDIGIDAKPVNFTIYKEKMRYIDFIPPRFKKGKDYLVGIPQPPQSDSIVPFLYKRYYEPEGILRRMWFSITTQSKDYEDLFFELVYGIIPQKLVLGVKNYFAELPFNKVRKLRNKKEIVDIIESFDNKSNIDDIREVATLFFPPRTLSWIDSLTSIDLFRPEDERQHQVDEAKKLIIGAV